MKVVLKFSYYGLLIMVLKAYVNITFYFNQLFNLICVSFNPLLCDTL